MHWLTTIGFAAAGLYLLGKPARRRVGRWTPPVFPAVTPAVMPTATPAGSPRTRPVPRTPATQVDAGGAVPRIARAPGRTGYLLGDPIAGAPDRTAAMMTAVTGPGTCTPPASPDPG